MSVVVDAESRSGGDDPPSRASLTLLTVHPHPDDESIACGGVLARAVAGGHRAAVATFTRGEAGHNLAGIDLGVDDLVTHRRRELAAALAALGVGEHHQFDYRDSGMAGTSDNDHPNSFHRADLYVAAAELARLLRAVRPHVVVSDDAHGTYGHPDHVKAHRVVVRAVAMAADPWWHTDTAPWVVAKRYVHTLSRTRMFRLHQQMVAEGLPSPFGDDAVHGPDDLGFGVADERVTTRVDVTPWEAQRRAALQAHRSQIASDSFFLNVPDEVARDAFGVEEFVLEEGVAPAAVEDDLFAGLEGR